MRYTDPEMPQETMTAMLNACRSKVLDYDALDAILGDFVTDSQHCAEVVTIFAYQTAKLVRSHFKDDIEAMENEEHDWMFSINQKAFPKLPESMQSAMQIVAALTNQDEDMFHDLVVAHMQMGEDHAVSVMSAQAYTFWMLVTEPGLIGK